MINCECGNPEFCDCPSYCRKCGDAFCFFGDLCEDDGEAAASEELEAFPITQD